MKTYKSAVDLWLAVILTGVPLAIIFTGLSVGLSLYFLHWHETLGHAAGFSLVGIGLTLAVLTGVYTLPCRYTLTDTELNIQCGVLKSVVRYEDIRRLELSCSLWVAPALSLNRVKIVLDDRFTLVSPKQRIEFIADLNARIDHLATRSKS
jgi:hypothetical protein